MPGRGGNTLGPDWTRAPGGQCRVWRGEPRPVARDSDAGPEPWSAGRQVRGGPCGWGKDSASAFPTGVAGRIARGQARIIRLSRRVGHCAPSPRRGPRATGCRMAPLGQCGINEEIQPGQRMDLRKRSDAARWPSPDRRALARSCQLVLSPQEIRECRMQAVVSRPDRMRVRRRSHARNMPAAPQYRNPDLTHGATRARDMRGGQGIRSRTHPMEPRARDMPGLIRSWRPRCPAHR